MRRCVSEEKCEEKCEEWENVRRRGRSGEWCEEETEEKGEVTGVEE
jgi:hypothetical protein